MRFEEKAVVRPKPNIAVGITANIVEIRIPDSCIRRVVPIVRNDEAHVNALPIYFIPNDFLF